MKTRFIASVILIFTGFGCTSDLYDYSCECTYTLGSQTGSSAIDITQSTETDAQAECTAYRDDLGGNAKCDLIEK